MKQVFFDIETKRTFDQVEGNFPEKLGISFVGVCVRDSLHGEGEMLGFFEEEIANLFPIFEDADMIVGYNSDHFDIPALAPYYSGDITRFPSLDLLARFKTATGHRVKLDILAQENLGKGKIGDGLDAIKYYETKQFEKLKQYCLMDVAITRDIYDYGMKHGKIKYKNKWNRLIETTIDFSFKPNKEEGLQMSLL